MCGGLLGLAVLLAGADSPKAVEPITLINMFNQTCRTGFPDVAGIKSRAVRDGWISREAHLIQAQSDPKLRNAEIPQFLQKDGLTLILTSRSGPSSKLSCQISGPVAKSLDLHGFASIVSPQFSSGEPTYVKLGGQDLARWNPTPNITVQASVNHKAGVHSASLLALLDS
jgi:hypothetical protein